VSIGYGRGRDHIRRRAVLGLAVLGALATAAPPTGAGPHAKSAPIPSPALLPFVRGICWEAAGRVQASDLAPLARVHAGWISQTPFGWQRKTDRPPVVLATGHKDYYWGESDEGLRETARFAHARGLRVLLKPHVWTHGGWSGEIAMRTPREWADWFRSYRTFILHYADLAEACGMEALAVGTELGSTTQHEREWRALIGEIRKRYRGKLVYCANWAEDLGHVRFWDALDWIGVQAYYPLADRPNPAVADLVAAWQEPLDMLEGLSRKWGKPVILTEVGYHSLDTAASRPWEWDLPGRLSLETQARCYEALFSALRDRPRVRGVFLWKWHPDYDNAGGVKDTEYTPERKPAEEVLRRAFASIEREGRP